MGPHRNSEGGNRDVPADSCPDGSTARGAVAARPGVDCTTAIFDGNFRAGGDGINDERPVRGGDKLRSQGDFQAPARPERGAEHSIKAGEALAEVSDDHSSSAPPGGVGPFRVSPCESEAEGSLSPRPRGRSDPSPARLEKIVIEAASLGESADIEAEGVDLDGFTVVKSKRRLRQEKVTRRSLTEERARQEANSRSRPPPPACTGCPQSLPHPRPQASLHHSHPSRTLGPPPRGGYGEELSWSCSPANV